MKFWEDTVRNFVPANFLLFIREKQPGEVKRKANNFPGDSISAEAGKKVLTTRFSRQAKL